MPVLHYLTGDDMDGDVACATDVGDPSPKRQRKNSIGSQLLETLSTELGLTAAQVCIHCLHAPFMRIAGLI
jgi:hypothetical protein